MGSLKGRDFLKLLDYTPEEINQLLSVAIGLKKKKHAGEPHRYLEGKQIAIIFEKDSTRTRCSFEVAARDLGMGVTYLGPTGSQMGKKETIADTANLTVDTDADITIGSGGSLTLSTGDFDITCEITSKLISIRHTKCCSL